MAAKILLIDDNKSRFEEVAQKRVSTLGHSQLLKMQ
jgi:hypothetical protein